VVVLGLLKIFLAVFFGGSALTLLDALPVAVLGVMLVIAGLELVGTGVWMLFECVEKEADKEREQLDDLGDNSTAVNKKAILQKNTLVAMVTAAVIVALKKTHYGAIAGWIVHMIYGNGFVSVSVWFGRRRTSRETR
jgi:xanthine/uracil permease